MRSEPLVLSAGRLEAFLRRVYCGVMRMFGITPFRIRAQGLTFLVGHKDLIDFRLAREGVWELEQLEFISARIDDRTFDLFLDIGANVGFYSLLFAKKKLAKEILAFEPDPGNRARLNANLEANGLSDDVWVLDYGLGDKTGEAILTEGNPYNRGESYLAQEKMPAGETTHRVGIKRFDDEFSVKDKRIYVKMDVEGYELFALRGMERTLRNNSCFLQIEVFIDDPEKLKTMVTGLGYRFLGTAEIDLFFSNIPE